MAAAPAAMAQQQQHDPALTVADTCALLGTDFPTMREFGQQIGSSDPVFSSVTQQQQARSSENVAAGQGSLFGGNGAQQKLSVRSMQPRSAAPGAQQLQAACKALPASPVAGAGSWVPVSDWNGDAGPYDGFMGASLFGDACGECGDIDADYGIDAASWNAADEDCFMHAELYQPVTPSVPAIRTMPVDSRQGFAGYGQRSLGAHCSEASKDTDLLQRTGHDSPVRSPASGRTCSASGSDASAVTGAAGFGAAVEGTCPSRSGGSCSLSSAPSNAASVARPAALSASQRCAADLMPAIGAGPVRRVPRLGAKPSDAELKETISALQRTTSRVPGSSDEAHTVSRAECLERYREKKLRRLDVNTIRYMKRKINADRRPRIKGRFVKAEELDAYRAGLLPGQNAIPVSL